MVFAQDVQKLSMFSSFLDLEDARKSIFHGNSVIEFEQAWGPGPCAYGFLLSAFQYDF